VQKELIISSKLRWFACEIEGIRVLAVAKVLINARSVSLEDFTFVFSIPLNLSLILVEFL